MKVNTPLTSKMLAYKELDDFKMDEAVDWAIEMIQLGFETPSILILAGIIKPTNFYETESYLIAGLKELDLQIPNREEAIFGYCKHMIVDIANGEKIKENLYQLYKVARMNIDDKPMQEFYLLYWAWSDLDYGVEYQHYWPEATLENIEQIVIGFANQWIATNFMEA